MKKTVRISLFPLGIKTKKPTVFTVFGHWKLMWISAKMYRLMHKTYGNIDISPFDTDTGSATVSKDGVEIMHLVFEEINKKEYKLGDRYVPSV